jgi:AcrR family transcriptional regulator
MHVRNSRDSSRSTATASASACGSTQADRSARSRRALLESAARGLSRYGYGNLILERVATEAGYTRGALYHQFKDKEDLALAVIDWVDETWRQEVGRLIEQQPDPVVALIVLARGHAVYCRRDGPAWQWHTVSLPPRPAARSAGRRPNAQVEVLPIPCECEDGFMAAFWARPHAYLDSAERAGTSPWHDLPAAVVDRALTQLRSTSTAASGSAATATCLLAPSSTSA